MLCAQLLATCTFSHAGYRDAAKRVHHEDRIVFVIVAIECVNMKAAPNVPRAPLDFVSPTEEVVDVLTRDATRVQETSSFVQRKFFVFVSFEWFNSSYILTHFSFVLCKVTVAENVAKQKVAISLQRAVRTFALLTAVVDVVQLKVVTSLLNLRLSSA